MREDIKASGIKTLFSILKIVLLWAAIYAFLVYKGMRFAPGSYVVQILLATFFFSNSMVSVPYGEKRILVLRVLNKKIRVLEEGTYFFFLLGLWGKIIVPKEFEARGKIISINTKDVFRHRQINRWEDILITFFLPMGKKFSLWNFFFCLVLGSVVGFSAVKIKRTYFPDNNKSVTAKVETKKQETLKSPQDLSSQNPIQTEQPKNYSSENSNNNSSVVEQGVWQPDRPYYEKMTWDNLTINDDYTAFAIMEKSRSSVNVRGIFTNSSYSKNYYPHVYVDGYDGDNDFFCKFFKVYIRKMNLKNGQTWSQTEIELCDYVNMIKNGSVNNKCFRDITISLKPQFVGKYRWHILDAGWGNNKNDFFKIYLDDGRYKTSAYEVQNWGIERNGSTTSNSAPRISQTPPQRSEQIQNQKSYSVEERNTQPQTEYKNYDNFVRNANITFIPHIILKDYSSEEIAKYLFEEYFFTGIKLVGREEIFRIVDRYDNEVPEKDCFSFVFAYKGRLYESYDQTVYRDKTTNQMIEDAHLSLNTPNNVYIINGRGFYFSGAAY